MGNVSSSKSPKNHSLKKRSSSQRNSSLSADSNAAPQLQWQQAAQQRQPPLYAALQRHHSKTAEASYSSFGDDDDIARPEAPSGSISQPEPEVHADGSLSLSTRIEYQALPCGQAQDVFGIVTLQAAAVPPAESVPKSKTDDRQPLDIICVLDVSGSMGGDKIRLVQDAVRFVIRESQPRDRLSIVAFNHEATRPLRLRRMDQHGKDEATQAVLRLSAGGGTCIASGLEMAVEIAERRRQRNPVSAILLLTDGQDGSSGNSFAPLIQRAQRAGCSLYPFGFGSDHDSRLLSSLAEQAQSPFTFVEDVDQIGPAFAGAIGGLSSVAAQRVEVVLQSRVTLKAVHTPFTTSGSLPAPPGNRVTVQIPDMLAGERRDLLVELSAPVANNGDETLLLEASAHYWDLAAKASLQVPTVQMRAQRVADEAQPEQEPDEEVTTQRQRVEVTQTLQAAAEHGDGGRFEKAQEILENHEKRLRTCKQRMSPITEGLASELEDARSRMQSRSSWEAGGNAELWDAVQMHRCQRTTNISMSSASRVQKSSKAMYCTKGQEGWISKFKS